MKEFTLISIFQFLVLSGMFGQHNQVQEIIDNSIQYHGGERFEEAHYSYDFRKHHYEYHYDHGDFRYERHHKDAPIIDILDNNGFTRLNNGKKVELSEKDSQSYANSVNSVRYFAFLPFFLNDAAVNKEYLGQESIKDRSYHKVKVWFNQEGGGKDFEDIYVYWFDTSDYSMDYLAYSFHVNGGGVRFREAYNARMVDGILFQDYVNFKHEKETPVTELGKLYQDSALTELSRIELENVKSLPRGDR